MTALVSSTNWQPSIEPATDNQAGIKQGIADLEQSIRIILSTSLGQVPMRPNFAFDGISLIDGDFDDTAPVFIQRATDAILKFEPRIKAVTIRAQQGDSLQNAHQSWFRITYTPVDDLHAQSSFEYFL